MKEKIKKLRVLQVNMLKQLVEIPVVARAMAPEMVRRAEFNIAQLDELITEMEAIHDNQK